LQKKEGKIEMKENTKIILGVVIAVILSITGSVLANTVLSADSVSYKTENGETTVDNALNALFGLADVNVRYNEETDCVQIYYNNKWNCWKSAGLQGFAIYSDGKFNVSITSNTEASTVYELSNNGGIAKRAISSGESYYSNILTSAFDMTNYSKIILNVTRAQTLTDTDTIDMYRIGVSGATSAPGDGGYSNFITYAKFDGSPGTSTIELDISSLTGAYSILIYSRAINKSAGTLFKINSIVLE
jgi:hypothetical protein